MSEKLKGKKVYAFGDSIVYGHTMPEKSFMQMIADEYGIALGMYAVNGATVVSIDSSKEVETEQSEGNYIINQVNNAPSQKPNVIIFNGYTNDAYGNYNNGHINIMEHLGEIQGNQATKFDNRTFCGGFEEILYTMQHKWANTPIVFVTVHKSGGRDWEIQCKLRDLALEMCEKWNVEVMDIFDIAKLDTRNQAQMEKYIMGGAGSHPNEIACREFYIPNIVEKLKELL